MANLIYSNGVKTIISDNKVIINGIELPPCPGKGHNITTINDKVYINGYEFKNDQWKRTLRALFHLLFS